MHKHSDFFNSQNKTRNLSRMGLPQSRYEKRGGVLKLMWSMYVFYTRINHDEGEYKKFDTFYYLPNFVKQRK